MPDETVWRTMLFDFYGDLLTDKQREYYDLHYNQDLSLAEIAASSGISRQGVWDNIRRADAALRDTEARLGLVRRFAAQRAAAAQQRAQNTALEAEVQHGDGIRAVALHVVSLLANHIAGAMATIVAQIEGLISLGRRSLFLLRATISHIVTTRERDVSLEILLRSLRCRWHHHGQGCQQK